MSTLGVRGDGPLLPKDALGSVDTSGVDNIVLLLFDGLGFREWRRQDARGFFGAMSKRGNVRPITTVFPSTTAAAITSLSTGLTPQEHGLPEWYVYMQEIGEVIVTLPFNRVGDWGRDTLKGELSPKALFDGTPIFQRLRDNGVASASLTPRPIAKTAYSTISRRGSDAVPYSTASDLSVTLRRLVENARGRNLFYVYWSSVDNIEHTYGPNTEEAEVEASLISHALEEGFLSKLRRDAAGRTLILATADHGQVMVPSENTHYMNNFRRLVRALESSPSGKKIPPWGSPRDSYMQVSRSLLDETQDYLAKKLEGVATVLKTEDAIEDGLFGLREPTGKFRRRVGNLMVLPHGTNAVWFEYEKESVRDLKGHHGGLSGDEMTIPLAAAKASDLQR